MFGPPEEENQDMRRVSHQNNNRKRKKKSTRKNQQQAVGKNKRKHSKLVSTMSAYAESFTFAATWQLKHEVSYWKAKALSLEYENGILHKIIRKNSCAVPQEPSGTEAKAPAQAEPDSEPTPVESDHDEEEEDEANGEDLVVSEEYIQFLQSNAKFKEDARKERERLQAESAENIELREREAGPTEPPENPNETLKELYGNKWQKIAALEMNLQAKLILESDKGKPMYWPHIPFNFNFS